MLSMRKNTVEHGVHELRIAAVAKDYTLKKYD